jgi:hypothetical protein
MKNFPVVILFESLVTAETANRASATHRETAIGCRVNPGEDVPRKSAAAPVSAKPAKGLRIFFIGFWQVISAFYHRIFC